MRERSLVGSQTNILVFVTLKKREKRNLQATCDNRSTVLLKQQGKTTQRTVACLLLPGAVLHNFLFPLLVIVIDWLDLDHFLFVL